MSKSQIGLEARASVIVGAAEICRKRSLGRDEDRVEVRHGDRSIELPLSEARVLAAALLQLTC